MHHSNLQNLNLVDLENYYLILDCIEKNTSEYLCIKNKLDKLVANFENKEAKLKKEDKLSKSFSSDESLNGDYGTETESNYDFDLEDFAFNGDILSNLMNLEKKNMFSSKKLYDFKSISIVARKKALADHESNLYLNKSKTSKGSKIQTLNFDY